jgi:hypothetical protein
MLKSRWLEYLQTQESQRMKLEDLDPQHHRPIDRSDEELHETTGMEPISHNHDVFFRKVGTAPTFETDTNKQQSETTNTEAKPVGEKAAEEVDTHAKKPALKEKVELAEEEKTEAAPENVTPVKGEHLKKVAVNLGRKEATVETNEKPIIEQKPKSVKGQKSAHTDEEEIAAYPGTAPETEPETDETAMVTKKHKSGKMSVATWIVLVVVVLALIFGSQFAYNYMTQDGKKLSEYSKLSPEEQREYSEVLERLPLISHA